MLLFATPSFGQSLSAIESEILAEETDSKDAKAEAKKKDKDIIEINSRFFITLGIDVAAVLLIILVVYYPNYRKMDTIFTFILFNIIIFLLTFVLNKVKISMGAAFGLFAVFSMLRYRTAGIGMKDMTYLFIFIALGLLSGIQLEYDELGIICGIIFLVTVIMDTKLLLRREQSKNIQFEKIDLVKPEHHAQLMEELRFRTGLNIHRISVTKLDYLKDIASIRIYYYE
ncbi:MAG: DUF4956 domain-containing protein [Bacteroidales bacterium]|nr:DUF4956 domain-containing protein [Bacteroidales bacterium]